MGGAERNVVLLVREAVNSQKFDCIEVLVLCWGITGTLDSVSNLKNTFVTYIEAPNHRLGLWAIYRFVNGKKYEFVFSSALHINAIASLMRRIGKIKTKRMVTRESTSIFDRKLNSNKYLIKMLYCLYGSQDLIVCQTKRMLDSLNKNTNCRFKNISATIPNPIDLDRINSADNLTIPREIKAIPIDRVKIVWCGRLVQVKNPERAIEVLKALHKYGHNKMHLIMIGDGPERKAVEASVERLGLTKHVTLTGHYPNPCRIMATCQLGLLTSDQEGFPNVIIEMIMSGVEHIVTTDCAGDLNSIPGVTVAKNNDGTTLACALLSRPPEIMSANKNQLFKNSNDYFKELLGCEQQILDQNSQR
jgi:glycosyltransferase involved in cell wall biosynthesis